MKLLTIIRHAKSSWDFSSSDFDRDITSKGIITSTNIALDSKKLINQDSLIWSSSATRTQKTAEVFLSVWKLDYNKIAFKDELYTFDAIKLEQIIKSCPISCNNLILFGHNNAITDFVNKFGDIFIDNVPTSGLVSIIFDTDNWNEIGNGKTSKIIFPSAI
jgi:phosphohistidine phosphatase